MGKVSVIIPIYFNADTIMNCYTDLKENALRHIPDYELILVDDGSKDDSWTIMNEIAGLDDHVRLVRLSRNFGSHAACLAGLSICTGDCATIKSADSQEPSSLILEMYEEWKKGNKVVLAVRSDRDEKFSQILFAKIYYRIVRKMALPNMPENGFDCYFLDRKVIEVLKLLDESNSAITLQILWAGFKTSKVTYRRQAREIGKSRWTMAKKIKLVVDSLVSFSFVPIRIITTLGAVCFITSTVWGIILLFEKLFGNIDVEGWTTLMIVVLISSGLIMLTLGILGEYLWRAMDASRNRPVFLIDDIVEKH